MKRRSIAADCLAALLLAESIASGSAALAGERPPNIIFILLDDQGWADGSSLGHPYMKTPNIHGLVREGTRFGQFYVSNPVCSPSRTAFMTGHFPARHRVHQHFATHQQNAQRGMPNRLDPDATTVCDLLKKAGYTTAHFGKWHLGSGRGAPDPGAYGIDVHRTVNSTGPRLGRAANGPLFPGQVDRPVRRRGHPLPQLFARSHFPREKRQTV